MLKYYARTNNTDGMMLRLCNAGRKKTLSAEDEMTPRMLKLWKL
jgi:hypothetical protein